jgi:hypothetical protein
MNAKTWLIALAALVLVAPAEQEVEVTVNARGRRERGAPGSAAPSAAPEVVL